MAPSAASVALGRPADYGLPFSTWSLAKLAEHLVAKGVVDDISHEGLRGLLREEGVSFQVVKTWKESGDPDFEAKKNRVLALYDIADVKKEPEPGDPVVVICVDEFGPLNLQPHPGRHWAGVGGMGADPGRAPSRQIINKAPSPSHPESHPGPNHWPKQHDRHTLGQTRARTTGPNSMTVTPWVRPGPEPLAQTA